MKKENFKSGFVSIIGRPNVGKSTLLNCIIGEKIVITSDKPQTTRNRIQGIHNIPGGQIVFIDTPGIHTGRSRLNKSMVDVARSAISGLRPPVLDDLGLAGGLASLAASIPEVDLELHLVDDRLPEHIEVALYRIAQECAQNVVKHARALVATVTFTVTDGVARLEVADNGVGFETVPGAPTAGYGMLSMAERAELVGGSLAVRSRPGGGTTVTVTVPTDG